MRTHASARARAGFARAALAGPALGIRATSSEAWESVTRALVGSGFCRCSWGSCSLAALQVASALRRLRRDHLAKEVQTADRTQAVAQTLAQTAERMPTPVQMRGRLQAQAPPEEPLRKPVQAVS